MVVKADISELKKASWREYGMRFLFGGLMTVIAGLIAKHYGPALGGLFLAFPAIAPAAATMIDQHAKEQKQRAGFEGHTRGRKTAALDMFGTVWGSVGLLAFALVIWCLGPAHNALWVLYLATVAWFVGALSTWELRRVLKRDRALRLKTNFDQVSMRNHRH
jgi:hypothetical protein